MLFPLTWFFLGNTGVDFNQQAAFVCRKVEAFDQGDQIPEPRPLEQLRYIDEEAVALEADARRECLLGQQRPGQRRESWNSAQPEAQWSVRKPRLLIDVEREGDRREEVELRDPRAHLKAVGGAWPDGHVAHRERRGQRRGDEFVEQPLGNRDRQRQARAPDFGEARRAKLLERALQTGIQQRYRDA